MNLAALKLKLSDIPGSDALSMQIIAGRQHYSINGKLVTLDAGASDAEAEDAIRQALANPGVHLLPESMIAATPPAVQTADSASLLPRASLQAAQETKTMSTPSPGGFAASLKAMMDEARAGLDQAQASGRARVKEAVGKLQQTATATVNASESVAKVIEDTAD